MPDIDLEELERLHGKATPGPWETESYRIYARNERGNLYPVAETILPIDFDNTYTTHKRDAAYIVAACNAVPVLIGYSRAKRLRVHELEHELESLEYVNRSLQEKVHELERQTVFLASRLSERSMHTVSTKKWLELAEDATREAGE